MSNASSFSEINDVSESNPSVSQSDDDVYDTDLEQEAKAEIPYEIFGRSEYLKACRLLGVTPTSFFIRNMHQEELSMPHHGLGPTRVKAMAFTLMNNASILSLNLEDNCLSADGGFYIARMLRENCYITHLNVSWNKLGSDGVFAMCKMLIVNTTLEVIDLSGNDITDDEANIINVALMENFRIRDINLSHNLLGYKSAVELTPTLKENDTIEGIDLSWNQFNPKGIVLICQSLLENSKLKTLNLSFNGIGNDGAEGIANLLLNNKVLKELNIGYCRITPQGGLKIADALKDNDALSVLQIDHNPIGTAGANELLKAGTAETSVIELLDLSGIDVDKAFMDVKKDCQAKGTLTVLHGKVQGDYTIPKRPKIFGVLFELTDVSNMAKHLECYGIANNLDVSDAVMGIEYRDELNLTPDHVVERMLKCGLELNEEQKQFVLDLVTVVDDKKAEEDANRPPSKHEISDDEYF